MGVQDERKLDGSITDIYDYHVYGTYKDAEKNKRFPIFHTT